MPFTIRRRGNYWEILRKDTGKVVGRSKTRAQAIASARIREQKSKGR